MRSIRIDPQFVSAPAGEASILTAKSWDSLIENDAARWEDQPRSTLQTVPDDEEDDEEIPAPGAHYYSTRGGDPPQVDNTSPRSVDSGTPGLTDKYSSAEEHPIDDKYSAEERIGGGLCTIISAADSFETEADDELVMRYEEESEEQQIPETPRRRLKLGLLSRIQSRRQSQQQQYPDEDAEEEEDELVQPVETPRTMDENRKPRRKLKLFKSFQNKKWQGRENPVEEEAPVDEIAYDGNQKDQYDLMLQPTDTLTDTERSHAEEYEIEEEEDEDIVTSSPKALQSSSSEDTGDPLIRNIRKQASRMIKRGRDPSSRAAEVTRGIDP